MKRKQNLLIISSFGGFILGAILSSTLQYISVSTVDFIALLPWIVALIAAGAISFVLYFQETKVTPKVKETPEILKKELIFDDAHNLQHLFIIHRKSSICLFDQSYIKIRFDPQLIGGFLAAISDFGRQVIGTRLLEELSYQKFRILLGEGAFIKAALVLKSNASKYMKDSLNNFIQEIEDIYWDYLSNFDGQLIELGEIFKIIEKCFSISITFPHKVAEKGKSQRYLNDFERAITEITQALSQEKQSFLTKDIVVIANITGIGSRAQIISTIFDLSKEAIFFPLLYLAPETVWKEQVEKRKRIMAKAEAAFHEGKLALATKHFEEAAEISAELGDFETQFNLKAKVEDIRSKEHVIKKQIEERKEEEKRLEIMNSRDALLKQASDAYQGEDYEIAEDYLRRSFKLSVFLDDKETIQQILGTYTTLKSKLQPLNSETREVLLEERQVLWDLAETEFENNNRKAAIDFYLQVASKSVELREIERVLYDLSRIEEIKGTAITSIAVTKIPKLIKPLSDEAKIPVLDGIILQLCDGQRSLDEIIVETGLPEMSILEILNKYQKKGFLQLLTVMK